MSIFIILPFEHTLENNGFGESGIYSVADITFTPLSFSVFLCSASHFVLVTTEFV